VAVASNMGRRPASSEEAAATLRHPSPQPPHLMLRLPSLTALAALAAAAPIAHAQQGDAKVPA